ncbi:MAG: hypothetical protein FWF70_03450 [Bacteroidetes bacterium]|nr:hypothetical protein [Bacteroidota bacterium]MCL1968605.1 hypothetical protein [Bacteroidota bacterium]
MKTSIYFILSLFLLCATELYAQTFASKKLTEIGELLHKTCLPATDSIFNCSQIIKGKQLVIQYNNKKDIEHIGVSLFSPETKKMINEPVCNFIERLMLELILQKNAADVTKKLQEYSITLEEKSMLSGDIKTPTIQTLLAKLQPPLQFTLLQEETIYYAGWQLKNGEQFAVTFPASRELIFGTNKKESDITISELLPNNRCKNIPENFTFITSDELESDVNSPNIFIRKGQTFTMPNLNSNTYLTKDTNDRLAPIFNTDNPTFSLQNLLLIKEIETSLKLHIKHRMYGNFSPEFEIRPSDFICFFQTEFDIYTHVDDSQPNILDATVILYNRMFNYMHLLTIKTPVNTLFEKNGILQADFYSNIPQHNITNLFNRE